MKQLHSINNPPSEPKTDHLIDRLHKALKTSHPQVKLWLESQIQALLTDIPFREAELKKELAPVKEIHSNHLLTPQDAAKLLNLPTRWVYRHLKKIPHRRFGRYVRFNEKELLKWAEGKRNLGI